VTVYHFLKIESRTWKLFRRSTYHHVTEIDNKLVTRNYIFWISGWKYFFIFQIIQFKSLSWKKKVNFQVTQFRSHFWLLDYTIRKLFVYFQITQFRKDKNYFFFILECKGEFMEVQEEAAHMSKCKMILLMI